MLERVEKTYSTLSMGDGMYPENKYSPLLLGDRMYPENTHSPIMAQVIALISVDQGKKISKKVMDAVLDVSKDITSLKPMMDNWNKAARSVKDDLNKQLAVTDIFRAICQSSMNTHQGKNDLGPMADLLNEGFSAVQNGNTVRKVKILLRHYNLPS